MTLLGGGAFVASLAYCAWTYLVKWRAARAPGFSPGALAVDLLLFTLFATHHSVSARDSVKSWIASIAGENGVRTVFVWSASALLALVCAAWRPVGPLIYRSSAGFAGVHVAIQLGGLWLVVDAVRRIDPLELAGIHPPTTAPLQTSGSFAFVRHPLYTGWILMVFGAGTLTADRLAFAAISSAYLIIAIPWEEASLRRQFGLAYDEYSRRVRWRVIPFVY